MKTFYYLFLSLRPKQWIKNLTLYIAILFSGNFFTADKFFAVSKGFLIFCGLTSAMYLLNDIVDRNRDKLHPGKKNRPIAAGKLKPSQALVAMIILLGASLSFSFALSEFFFICCISYIVMMASYSLVFRQVIIFDALLVAFGFVFRIWAGALVSAVPISSWLIICTTAVALLISFGRRRCEITLLEHQAPAHRHTLEHYPVTLLDTIIASVTSFSLMSYSFYTFITPGPAIEQTWIPVPQHWESPKWLMITIPVVIYGIFRYLYLIYEKKEALSPEEILFKDMPLLAAIMLYIGAVFTIIYGIV